MKGMNPLSIIRTGDEAGSSELYSTVVDRILSEISRLYFERARALQSGDQEAFQTVDREIATLKDQLTKL